MAYGHTVCCKFEARILLPDQWINSTYSVDALVFVLLYDPFNAIMINTDKWTKGDTINEHNTSVSGYYLLTSGERLQNSGPLSWILEILLCCSPFFQSCCLCISSFTQYHVLILCHSTVTNTAFIDFIVLIGTIIITHLTETCHQSTQLTDACHWSTHLTDVYHQSALLGDACCLLSSLMPVTGLLNMLTLAVAVYSFCRCLSLLCSFWWHL